MGRILTFNTNLPILTKEIAFKVVYRRVPLNLLSYVSGITKVEAIGQVLQDRNSPSWASILTTIDIS